jgi:hypothetical protein
VEIDARYASFKIVRKEDELTDENFPVTIFKDKDLMHTQADKAAAK